MSRHHRDAAEIARLSTAAMWADDAAGRWLGLTIDEVGPGRAVASLVVQAEMTNSHGTCHGGVIFALADTAFGYAANSHGQRSVAHHCTVTYVNPGRRGDRLTAQATERMRAGRSGICDVTVVNQDGTLIAEFRGHSRTIKGSLVDGEG